MYVATSLCYTFLAELEEYKSKMTKLEEQYRNRMTELTEASTGKATSSSCHGIELEEKVKEVADLNEQVLKAFRIVKKKEKECSKLNKALNECEGIFYLLIFFFLLRTSWTLIDLGTFVFMAIFFRRGNKRF